MPATFRQQFESAMRCKTKEEAQAWLEKEIKRYGTELKVEPKKARENILHNLGYIAGYYDSSVAHKVHELFGAVHPVFGSADYHETVTPQQALDAGWNLAKKENQS